MAYKPEDFYVGQRVRIREWDDMKEEFGVDAWGNIECRFNFIPSMDYLCGAEATIVKLESPLSDKSEAWKVYLDDWGDIDPSNYKFSTHMLEPVDNAASVEFDGVAFAAMLGI